MAGNIDLLVNNFTTTLGADITNVATSLTLASATGAPAIGTGQQWKLLLDDGTNQEIIAVTALSGTTATITRAVEAIGGSQTAHAFAAATPTNVYGAVTAGQFTNVGGPVLIGSQTVSGTSTSKVLFTSIPATYNHLRLVAIGRSLYGSASNDNFYLRMNTGATSSGDTGSNYQYMRMMSESGSQYDSGTGAGNSGYAICGFCPSASNTANYAGILTVDIPGYAQSSFYTHFVSNFHTVLGAGTAQSDIGMYAGYWTNTGAVTVIELGSLNGNLASGTLVSLYGLY